MESQINLQDHSCCHEGCPDYGKRGLGNIVIKERYGKNDRALLKCRTCGHCFSETRGTIFFGLNTPEKEVLDVLAQLVEKGSIRGVARATKHDKNTICRWLKKAAEHCRAVNKYFLHNLHLTQVQIDEIWSFCKKQKNVTCTDPEDVGDIYSLTVINSESRLLICHHEGSRSVEDANALFRDLEQKRAVGSSLPVFVSDDWDPFAHALLEVYGIMETPAYKGTGRKPNPVLIPHPDLKYAQIIKNKTNNEVVGIFHRVVFGDPNEVIELLCSEAKGHVHTSYIERMNLTFRNHLARFIRKTMNFSKDRRIHTGAIDFFQAWYNLIKPHDSLKIEINIDMMEVGFQQNPKKWIFQTPAMVELLADHVWTMKELMNWKVPIQ